MSKFEYERTDTTITDFSRNITMFCENELDESAHEKVLGKLGALFKDKAIVYLIMRYANIWHDAEAFERMQFEEEDSIRDLYAKWASEGYTEARDLAWVIADMLA